MIIVRIETDIAPLCAPRQLLSYKAAGIFVLRFLENMHKKVIPNWQSSH